MRKLPTCLRQTVLILFLVAGGYPILWMTFSSVRPEGELRRAPFAVPLHPTGDSYLAVFKSGGFGRAYLNSSIISCGAVALATAVSAMAAYAFARMRFRGREVMFLLFLAGMMVPPHVTLVPLNRLMGPGVLDLKNTYLALIGPYVGFALPISILILRAAFEEVPVDLEDAARIDGCGWWRIFWHVALPLVRPALATVIIFNFLTMWNEFAFALTLISDAHMRTLPLALWEFKGERGMMLGQTCAAMCLAVLPMLVLYILAQRHIIRGLTAGAVSNEEFGCDVRESHSSASSSSSSNHRPSVHCQRRTAEDEDDDADDLVLAVPQPPIPNPQPRRKGNTMPGSELTSLRDTWYHNLEKFPRKTAVICEGLEHSYAECDLLTDRLRRNLAERFGFQKGGRVAIAGPNSFEYFIAYWAVMKSGGVVVPVNIRLGPDEMAHVITQSDAATLIVFKPNWAHLQRALEKCPNVKHVIAVGFSEEGVTPFESLIAEGGEWPHHPEIAEDDAGIVMFTSGTTGVPKGGLMRQGELLFNNRLAIYAHGIEHADVHLLVITMFHPTAAYSLLPASALVGSTIVMAPRPDAAEIVQLIQKHRVTTCFGVPSLFQLLDSYSGLDKYDLSSLRLLAYSGSPMSPATIRRLRQRFPRVRLHNFFGLTETISMTHVLPDADADTRPDSIGKLLPHVRQRILDEHGNECPPNVVGELHFHRSNVISGYWKQPGLIEKAMRGEWFNTGDLGLVDKQGYVYLKGRSKEMIKVAGEQVHAVEVENCISLHEKVQEVAVVGVPATGVRAHLGELVKAFIVPRPGVTLTEPEIKRHCMERLATYKVPQLVEFRADLPRNAAGKVVKRLLQ